MFGGGQGQAPAFSGFRTPAPATSLASATPFNFGTPITPIVSSGSGGGFSGGLGFTATPAPTAPTTQPAPATGGFSFGNPIATTTPAPSFGFGSATSTPAASAPTLTLGGLGTSSVTAPSTTSLTFGTATASVAPTTTTSAAPSTGFSFGGPPTTSASAPTLTLGSLSALGAAPTATTSGFSFGGGTTATTTSAPTTGGFLFGATSSGTTTTAAGTAPTFSGFGLLGATTATTQPTTTATTSTFTGLGGVASSGAGGLSGYNSGSSSKEGRAALDLPVPQELLQVVEDFKNHIKNHKVKMSEITRTSDKSIEKVSEEVEETRINVSKLESQIHRQVMVCNSFMRDIRDELENLEMAIITRDTPYALQPEITAPTSYFFSKLRNYGERMVNYKREIEKAEIALASLSQGMGAFSPKELVSVLCGTKDTVVALAARIQDLHEQVNNAMCLNTNLQRFPTHEQVSAAATRRGISTGGSGREGENSTSGGTSSNYEQAFHRLSNYLGTPDKSRAEETLYHRPAGVGSASSTPVMSAGISSPVGLFNTASNSVLGNSSGAQKRTKQN